MKIKKVDDKPLVIHTEAQEEMLCRQSTLYASIASKRANVMYRAEFEFNTSIADPDTLEKVCAKTDEIFAQEDLACCDKAPGRRVYQDKGRKQDYGRFWAAFFALKDMADILEHLKECFWYNGNQKENLLTGFLRN